MEFLTGIQLNRGVEDILREPDALLVVAFLGAQAQAYLQADNGQKKRVVCNLTMGGTNPFTVESLLDHTDFRHSDTLHAKVYIGKQWTVVTSANLSANGLGLETDSASGWREAGVQIATNDEILSWFQEVWESSKKVRQEDLDRAKTVWWKRKKSAPPVGSLEQHVIGDDFPLLAWMGNDDWEVCEESAASQVGDYNEEVEQWINDSLEIEHEEDLDVVTNRWFVWVQINRNGNVSERANLHWMRAGERVIRKAYRYKTSSIPYDCLLTDSVDSHGPFPISGDSFKKAFWSVINTPEYERLRTDDRASTNDGTWYDPDRLRLMKQLWLDVQAELRAKKSQ